MTLRLPDPCLVVLVGATAAGKSTWARAWFDADQVVSSDRLRAVVGAGERDQRASRDAFELLDLIVAKRLRARADDRDRHDRAGAPSAAPAWRALAERHGVPAVRRRRSTRRRKVVRERNRARGDAGAGEGRRRAAARGRAASPSSSPARASPASIAAGPVDARAARVPRPRPPPAARQAEDPLALEFGLQISRFGFAGHPATTAATLADDRARRRGGRLHEPVGDGPLPPDPAGRARVGGHARELHDARLPRRRDRRGSGSARSSPASRYRNLAHLAKIVATLDVALRRPRAVRPRRRRGSSASTALYGWDFPPLRERYALLEDALELLPLMWGPGAPRFEGRTTTVAEAICYPRPLQERIPILVGGSGERRTLRLVARHADACNLFGDPATVRHKVARAARALRDRGPRPGRRSRSPTSRPRAWSPPASRARARARRRVEEHVGRYRELAEAGVQTAIVGLSDARGPESVTRFADVIAAFRSRDERRAARRTSRTRGAAPPAPERAQQLASAARLLELARHLLGQVEVGGREPARAPARGSYGGQSSTSRARSNGLEHACPAPSQ